MIHVASWALPQMEVLPHLANLANFTHCSTEQLGSPSTHGLPVTLCACLIISVYIGSMLPYLFSARVRSLSWAHKHSQTIRSLINLFIPPLYSGWTLPGHWVGPSHCKWEKYKPSELSDQCAPWRTRSLSLSLSSVFSIKLKLKPLAANLSLSVSPHND